MKTTTTIKTIAFGDKATIARQLTTKGTEQKAEILAGALLPMLSNYLAGHSTFKGVIKGQKHNAACPLQCAVASLKLKAKTARDQVFSLATLARDQETHDSIIESAALAIYTAVQSAPKAPSAPRTDYKALSEALSAELAIITAERDALAQRLASLETTAA